MPRYIVAITGASGVVYGTTLVNELLQKGMEVHLVVSRPACIVLEQELGWKLGDSPETALAEYFPVGQLFFYNNDDIAARLASGSFMTDGMVIVPCTMSTLSSVACGMSNNLIERAADVMLKERRLLILVPRETPLSSIHLRNMLQLSDMGAVIVPAMPAFYHRPETIYEMVSFMVGKILDVMKVPNQTFKRYE